MFNAVICCVHSGHAVATSLASASLENCIEHGDGMRGMASSRPDHAGANLAASLGCPLCSSAGGMALSSHWTPELFALEPTFAPSASRAVSLIITERAPSQPRAPPFVS